MFKSAYFLFLAVVFSPMAVSGTTLGKNCDADQIIGSCGPHQRCTLKTQNTYHCTCQRNFTESAGECVIIPTHVLPPTDSPDQQVIDETTSSGNSVAVGILIPTFLILLGGLGFCCAKRYRLLPWRQNLYGNVLVTRDEDDDDDPPIA